jgi:hypothetical protein
MKKHFLLTALIIICLSVSSFAQLDSVFYQGPASGSVASGVAVTLTQFSFDAPPEGENIIADRNLVMPYSEPAILELDASNLPEYVYTEDSNVGGNQRVDGGQTILLDRWPGIPMGNSIPPDPIVAVGPNHVIACVNSQFRVWDKEGNQLANINADSWISPVINAGAFDPQIIYDHYADRWFMLWDWQDSGTLQAYFIISYSDNSDPFGSWYMYKMDAKLNGTTNSNTWGDYPQIGFDDEAIYINSRSFSFPGFYQYNRIRILNKSELYSSNGGTVPWKDIWNIGRPGTPSNKPDVLEPAISYSPGNGGYFFNSSQQGGNFYILYKIINPVSSLPRLRGKVIVTQYYYEAPDAQQLGGGMTIDGGGSKCRHHPMVRDGYLYAAHSVGNSTNPIYSSAKYVKLDLNTTAITEQAELGAIGYYYLYPALTVDKEHNIAVTFSRSATTEYCGAFFSTKHNADPPGLIPSIPIQEGLGNYVVTFGGERNRWGDYLGIYLDPVNELDIWTFTEYVASTNTWGTYVGKIRMEPFEGFYTFVSPNTLDFGDIEVNKESNVLSIVVANYGTNNLEITDIGTSAGPFTRVSNHTIPDTLESFDSLVIEIKFSPTQAGDYDEMLSLTSNDPALTGLHLNGHAYNMMEAYSNIFYASTGSGNNGDMLTLDKSTGVGITLGPSLFSEVKRIAVNPVNNIIYGLVSEAGGTGIVRVNAEEGDAYNLFTIDLPSVSGIAFDTLGTLFIARQTGQIYSVDLTNGSYTLVTQAAISINAMAFEPATNQLWVAIFKAVGSGKDSIYTVDIVSGAETPIGVTGFNIMTNDLAFDNDSKLYGVIGAATSIGKLIEINTSNGTGTQIGETGFNHVVGLAYSLNGPIVSVEENKNILPKEFSLKQNYPNPFNPTTKIEFSLPVAADVQLVVYNILGQQVAFLVNEQRSAGNHSIFWNADDSKGMKLSSGIYLYKIKATGNDGSEFQETRKMILLK